MEELVLWRCLSLGMMIPLGSLSVVNSRRLTSDELSSKDSLTDSQTDRHLNQTLINGRHLIHPTNHPIPFNPSYHISKSYLNHPIPLHPIRPIHPTPFVTKFHSISQRLTPRTVRRLSSPSASDGLLATAAVASRPSSSSVPQHQQQVSTASQPDL